jgi:hypothetical protein
VMYPLLLVQETDHLHLHLPLHHVSRRPRIKVSLYLTSPLAIVSLSLSRTFVHSMNSQTLLPYATALKPPVPSSVGIGRLVQTEIGYRKKEALGLNPSKRGEQGRKLGSGSGQGPASMKAQLEQPSNTASSSSDPSQSQWACGVCTL